jgi:hypothetical protein
MNPGEPGTDPPKSFPNPPARVKSPQVSPTMHTSHIGHRTHAGDHRGDA